MHQKKVLLVEDDPNQLKTYCEMLATLGFKVYGSVCKRDAVQILETTTLDILISDIHLTHSAERDSFEGFEIIDHAKSNNPECMLIVMTNDPKVSTYKRALELGALNFVKKPICSAEEFELAITGAMERKDYHQIKTKLDSYQMPRDIEERCLDGLVLSATVRNSINILIQAHELPCVIYGETGTGKEEVAKLIHKKRVKNEGPIPFVALNCANLDSTTAASQLFGHKKGSFTGADSTTSGYIGEANGGILFLDEIHLLSLDCQRRLLRVLNDGSYQRMGDTKTLYSNFQLIVASGKNLDQLVKQGEFMPDLRSRITGIFINLFPLRKRVDDLELLVPLIFAKLGANLQSHELSKIIERCKTFYWQDNIRQLYNTLRSTMIICQCEKKLVTADDLQVYPSMFSPDESENSFKAASENDVSAKILAPLKSDLDFSSSIEFYEKALLSAAIKRHEKLSNVVEKLGISRSSLDMKRKKYELTE